MYDFFCNICTLYIIPSVSLFSSHLIAHSFYDFFFFFFLYFMLLFFFFFFFQAEDGIRDGTVTGVQTCALPIWLIAGLLATQPKAFAQGGQVQISSEGAPTSDLPMADLQAFDQFRADHPEIAHALSHNPKLISSKSFQAKNPALRDFLSAHSGVETAFAE